MSEAISLLKICPNAQHPHQPPPLAVDRTASLAQRGDAAPHRHQGEVARDELERTIV